MTTEAKCAIPKQIPSTEFDDDLTIESGKRIVVITKKEEPKNSGISQENH